MATNYYFFLSIFFFKIEVLSFKRVMWSENESLKYLASVQTREDELKRVNDEIVRASLAEF